LTNELPYSSVLRLLSFVPMNDWLSTIEQNLAAEKLFAAATLLEGDGAAGNKLLIYPDGSYQGELLPAELQAQVIADARELMRQETSTTLTYGETQVYIEVYAPPPRLIIVGGVHTAIPLSQYARILGFRVTIVDGRGRFATRERFPDVDEIIVAWPDEALPKLRIDHSTYVVILTHDPKFDLPTLKVLANCSARYIGAMGSRETRRQHMAQLRAEGVPDEFLQSVYGPVGLDLGARSPEEVALSIIAEIVAVRYGHAGEHLKGI
jgi:xanthine dehydrogenase accessory factor